MTEFLLDSCVMIEILHVEESLLYRIGKIGQPTFVDAMLGEVPMLTDDLIDTFDIKIVEADWEDMTCASLESQSGPLSFQDILCYLTAKRHGFTCLTMDKKLYEKCQSLGIPVLRFLALLLHLVQKGVLTKTEAREYARKSCQRNPRMVPAVFNDFLEKLDSL